MAQHYPSTPIVFYAADRTVKLVVIVVVGYSHLYIGEYLSLSGLQ